MARGSILEGTRPAIAFPLTLRLFDKSPSAEKGTDAPHINRYSKLLDEDDIQTYCLFLQRRQLSPLFTLPMSLTGAIREQFHITSTACLRKAERQEAVKMLEAQH